MRLALLSALCANKMWGAFSCGARCYARTKYMSASRSQRLFELPPDTRVFPGHGPLTSIEREIRNNPMVSDGATI